MSAGLILIGVVLGAAAGVGTLLLGSSIWIALLVYTVIGGGSILVLAVSVALRPDPKDLDEPPKPYAPKCPAQNLKRGDSMRSAGHPCGSISVAPQTSQNPADSQTHDVALHLVWKD